LKPVWKTEGVATARIKDMIDGEIVLDDIVYCCPERASKFEKTTLIEGDLLIAKDGGTLGKTAFVPLELQGGNVTQHVLRFSISPTLSKEFIRLIIDSPIGQGYMKGETKGVALPGVNVGDFRKMPVALPPIEEQRRIVSAVNQMVSICEQLKASLKESHIIQWHLTDAIVKQAV
jgi:type I restriction enzyme S subunit